MNYQAGAKRWQKLMWVLLDWMICLLGGAKDQSGVLYISKKDGKFKTRPRNPALECRCRG